MLEEPTSRTKEVVQCSQHSYSDTAHDDERLCALLEATLFASPESLTLRQLSVALAEPETKILRLLASVMDKLEKPHHGLTIRTLASRYQIVTKPQHHQHLCEITRRLRPPALLSIPALQTLAIIAYKQPISALEIQAIRQVSGAGVLRTLLKRKWIFMAGRKKGSRQALLYRTTRLFLIEFGLHDLKDLASLQDFQQIARR